MEISIEHRSDWELLQEYTTTGSESAFATLVNRHLQLVYSVALRQCSDHLLAQEVASNVFLTLASKAHTLRRDITLAGWLFKAARYVASNARSFQSRRRKWESEAAQCAGALHHETSSASEAEVAKAWEIVSEQLDLAVAELSEPDRNAILLRFYESKSLREIGAEFGITEEAARKRTTRALEKLRKSMLGRGVVCPTTALGLAISTYSAQSAPPGLAETITQASANASPISSIPEKICREFNQSARTSFLSFAFLAILACGLLYSGIRTYWNRVPEGVGPKEVFIHQTDTLKNGAGEEYVKTLYLNGPEELATGPFFVDSVRLRFKLRTSLVKRFGEDAFARSSFPRFLDMLDTNRLATATELIAGNKATLQLPWGPRLPFVRDAGAWKLDYFRLPNVPAPARYQAILKQQNRIVENATSEFDSGHWGDINAGFQSVLQRTQQVRR